MVGNMVLGRGKAVPDKQTLFGQNISGKSGTSLPLKHFLVKEHSPGETLQSQYLEIPQIRRTNSLIGFQPDNIWGVIQGTNHHGLVVGTTGLPMVTPLIPAGLTGPDLV